MPHSKSEDRIYFSRNKQIQKWVVLTSEVPCVQPTRICFKFIFSFQTFHIRLSLQQVRVYVFPKTNYVLLISVLPKVFSSNTRKKCLCLLCWWGIAECWTTYFFVFRRLFPLLTSHICHHHTKFFVLSISCNDVGDTTFSFTAGIVISVVVFTFRVGEIVACMMCYLLFLHGLFHPRWQCAFFCKWSRNKLNSSLLEEMPSFLEPPTPAC